MLSRGVQQQRTLAVQLARALQQRAGPRLLTPSSCSLGEACRQPYMEGPQAPRRFRALPTPSILAMPMSNTPPSRRRGVHSSRQDDSTQKQCETEGASWRELLLPSSVMVGGVIIANAFATMPITDFCTYGTLVYPVTFLASGLTNARYGAQAARSVVLVGFALGCPLSLLTATPRVASSSAVSFLISQYLETYVFDRLARTGQLLPSATQLARAQLASSTFASAIDSALFSTLALSGTGLPWVTLGIGDFAVKVVCALLALAPFRAALGAVLPKKPRL